MLTRKFFSVRCNTCKAKVMRRFLWWRKCFAKTLRIRVRFDLKRIFFGATDPPAAVAIYKDCLQSPRTLMPELVWYTHTFRPGK